MRTQAHDARDRLSKFRPGSEKRTSLHFLAPNILPLDPNDPRRAIDPNMAGRPVPIQRIDDSQKEMQRWMPVGNKPTASYPY